MAAPKGAAIFLALIDPSQSDAICSANRLSSFPQPGIITLSHRLHILTYINKKGYFIGLFKLFYTELIKNAVILHSQS